MKQKRISKLKANEKITIEGSNESKKEEDISVFLFLFYAPYSCEFSEVVE